MPVKCGRQAPLTAYRWASGGRLRLVTTCEGAWPVETSHGSDRGLRGAGGTRPCAICAVRPPGISTTELKGTVCTVWRAHWRRRTHPHPHSEPTSQPTCPSRVSVQQIHTPINHRLTDFPCTFQNRYLRMEWWAITEPAQLQHTMWPILATRTQITCDPTSLKCRVA